MPLNISLLFTLSLLLYHLPLPLNTCLMSLTPPTTPLPSKKIQIHSPFLHTRLPQMLPLVQYAQQSPPLLHSTESETKTSLTQKNLPPANSMTQTKKMYRRQSLPQPLVLVPPFKQEFSEGPKCLSPSLMTTPSTEPSSLPSQEYKKQC